ncbi:hypothetical protein [Nocardia sp. CA-290969]|uniref:hypothetical protein n=1 Tax=Nocardia sp. CA-290969 TaxID=3239986 RepID=UPI003D8EC56F
MTDVHIFHYLGRSPLPPLSDKDRDNARRNPGKWFYYIDPAVPTDGPIHPENVMSGRRADEEGNVTDEVWRNADFVPKPETARMRFANAFELIFWRTLEGYCPAADFVDGLSRAEFITMATPEQPGMVPIYPENDGEQVLRIYTSAQFLPNDANPWLRVPISGKYVLDEICPIENSVIHFNPGGRPSVGFAGSMIASLWDELQTVNARIRADEENGISRPAHREPGRPQWMP